MDTSRFSFLHRRPFWAVLLSVGLIISFYTFSSLLATSNSPAELFTAILSIVGGTTFGVVADILSATSKIVEYSAITLFLIFLIAMLYKTFHDSQVKIIYPLILSVNWLLSFTLLFLFLSSLS